VSFYKDVTEGYILTEYDPSAMTVK